MTGNRPTFSWRAACDANDVALRHKREPFLAIVKGRKVGASGDDAINGYDDDIEIIMCNAAVELST